LNLSSYKKINQKKQGRSPIHPEVHELVIVINGIQTNPAQISQLGSHTGMKGLLAGHRKWRAPGKDIG
jgi:hypothetical protein